MSFFEIGFPLTLIIIAFFYKLFIDRTVSFPFLVDAVLELPIDIIFLASSLIVAFTITTTSFVKEGLFRFAIYMSIALIIVVLRRRSSRMFESNKFFWTAALVILNYSLCFGALILAITFVIQD